MKNSYKTILSYVFIVICSFVVLNFQASTVNIVSKNALAQDYDVEGFVDENGDKIEFANHPKQIVKIKVPHPVYENDLMRNRDDKNVLDKMIYL